MSLTADAAGEPGATPLTRAKAVVSRFVVSATAATLTGTVGLANATSSSARIRSERSLMSFLSSMTRLCAEKPEGRDRIASISGMDRED